jgi:hypothetical protein
MAARAGLRTEDAGWNYGRWPGSGGHDAWEWASCIDRIDVEWIVGEWTGDRINREWIVGDGINGDGIYGDWPDQDSGRCHRSRPG